MPNLYVNKVTVNGTDIIDLTSDTVTPATLMQGYTAHDRSGAAIVGTASGGAKIGVVHLGTVTSVYTGITATQSGTVLHIGG